MCAISFVQVRPVGIWCGNLGKKIQRGGLGAVTTASTSGYIPMLMCPQECAWYLPDGKDTRCLYSDPLAALLPLSCSEVASRTATEIASVCVGAAVTAGAATC